MIGIDMDTGILPLHQGFVEKIEPATELEELKRAFPIIRASDPSRLPKMGVKMGGLRLTYKESCPIKYGG